MTEPLRTDRPLIEPMYAQAEPGEPISLAAINVAWSHNGTPYQAAASVTMQFMPDDRLRFVVATNDQTGSFALSAIFADDWNGKLRLLDTDVTVDTFCVGATASSKPNGTLVFAPKRSVVTPTKPSDCITTVTFHLFNFPDFISETDYFITHKADNQSGWTRCGRLVLNAEGWDITIAASDKTKDLCDRLRQQGGFIITHVGTIQRTDRSPFSTEQLQDLLYCLHSFLSLALGRWAGLALPVGFDSDGKKVFEQWGMPMAAKGPWSGSSSWLDANHGQILSEVFPKFFVLWRDSTWHPTLQASLYWYLAANERATGIGVDAGIILAQTALERLAWTYCVTHRKMVSKDAFSPRKGLSAANKLRLLASTLEIPTEIPSEMTALNAKRGSKWNDAPDAIASIRNSLVHPSETTSLPDGSYYEAWKLSTWFLDLVFLRLCGHDGSYSNRVTKKAIGQVEQVPWAKRHDPETRKAD